MKVRCSDRHIETDIHPKHRLEYANNLAMFQWKQSSFLDAAPVRVLLILFLASEFELCCDGTC